MSQQGTPTEDLEKSRYMYYFAHGNYNIASNGPNHTQYPGGLPYNYYPDDGSPIDTLNCPRSDVILNRYTRLYRTDEGIMYDDDDNSVMNGLYTVTSFQNQLHLFKDNKNKDNSIAFFSKYNSNWEDKDNIEQ